LSEKKYNVSNDRLLISARSARSANVYGRTVMPSLIEVGDRSADGVSRERLRVAMDRCSASRERLEAQRARMEAAVDQAVGPPRRPELRLIRGGGTES
jgi:hypothetical protein